jgi:hypothetical protein
MPGRVRNPAVHAGAVGHHRGGRGRRRTGMADVAYAALTIGVFALLALLLRGLEKLR